VIQSLLNFPTQQLYDLFIVLIISIFIGAPNFLSWILIISIFISLLIIGTFIDVLTLLTWILF